MVNTLYVYYLFLNYYVESLARWYDKRFPEPLPDCTADILCERNRWHKKDCPGGTVSTERYVRGILSTQL